MEGRGHSDYINKPLARTHACTHARKHTQINTMDVIGGMGVMGGMVVIVRMDAGQVNIYTVNGRYFLDGI